MREAVLCSVKGPHLLLYTKRQAVTQQQVGGTEMTVYL